MQLLLINIAKHYYYTRYYEDRKEKRYPPQKPKEAGKLLPTSKDEGKKS